MAPYTPLGMGSADPAALADGSGADPAWEWEHHWMDSARFKKGNPGFDSAAGSQNMPRLKAGREKYMASTGYGLGMLRQRGELAAEGRAMAAATRAAWEARELRASVGEPERDPAGKRAPRM